MKKIVLILSLLLGVLSCKSPVQKEVKKKSTPNDTTELAYSPTSALAFLTSDDLAGRDTGSEGINKAAEYLEKTFKEFDIPPYFETYRDSFQFENADGYNIVARLKSDSKKYQKPLIIGAHYDHIGIIKAIDNDSIANGANDNASGTVAVLELAQFLSDKLLDRDIIFALFSGEEHGLLGSKHLAKTMKSMEVKPYLVFNFEMLGVPLKDKNYEAYITGYDKSNFAKVFNDYYDEEFLGYLPEASKYGLFKRSDNYPFYEVFSVPSHTVCTFDFTNYEYYHHVNDELAELDIEAYLKLVNAMKPGVLQLINETETTVKLN